MSNETERKPYIITKDYEGKKFLVALTEEQVNLFNWLIDKGILGEARLNRMEDVKIEIV